MEAPATSVKLRSGYDMPRTAFGTWRTSDEPLRAALKAALTCGVRHFDAAHVYFNEPLIGEVLCEAISSRVVTRDELFITSKLMPSDMHPEHAREALELTLKNLQVSYLDLYLLVSMIVGNIIIYNQRDPICDALLIFAALAICTRT